MNDVPTTLRIVLEQVLAEYTARGYKPEQINNGSCSAYATKVQSLFPSVTIETGPGLGHTWVKYQGRHYDAECLDGVENRNDLPFFKRN